MGQEGMMTRIVAAAVAAFVVTLAMTPDEAVSTTLEPWMIARLIFVVTMATMAVYETIAHWLRVAAEWLEGE